MIIAGIKLLVRYVIHAMRIPPKIAPGICAGLMWMKPNNNEEMMMGYQELIFHLIILRSTTPRTSISSAIGPIRHIVSMPIGLGVISEKSSKVGRFRYSSKILIGKNCMMPMAMLDSMIVFFDNKKALLNLI